MNKCKIIDNVIPRGYADQIESDILRTGFPWLWIDDVTNTSYGANSGLVHAAYDYGKQPTDWYPFIKPLVYSIEEASGVQLQELLRIRVGFLFRHLDTKEYNTPHIDFTMPHYTACYYVNDSDGDTVVFDQHLSELDMTDLTEANINEYVKQTEFTVANRCSPRKGRVCVFDGYQFHASSMPKVSDKRLVITVNFIGQV